MYQHYGFSTSDDQGLPASESLPLPAGKVVCVGRNYGDHIQELGNQVPSEPVLFIKPNTALCHAQHPLTLPQGQGACHNELELAVLIQAPLTNATEEQAREAIWGIGLGLDLTLRAVQTKLKQQQLPWERAKAFDLSCPLTPFIALANLSFPLQFSLEVNQQPRQQGCSDLMLVPIPALLQDISQTFTLLPGDVVMTGTPKGVAALEEGDQLTLTLEGHFCLTTSVSSFNTTNKQVSP